MAATLHLWFSFLLTIPAGDPARAAAPQLFAASDRCMACHNGMATPTGEDASIGVAWRTTMMANSARDPYWQAAVRREVLDHPAARAEIEHECAACHMPMPRFEAKSAGRRGEVFAHLPIGARQERAHLLAADGVSCTVCHQIRPDGLGGRSSFTAGFVIDTRAPRDHREIYGLFDVDPGRRTIMRSAAGFVPVKADHLASSELCATCHTLITHTLGPRGEAIGELPEQVPYLEWRHSAFARTRSCQSCHMPRLEEPTPISSVLGEPRSGFVKHVFQGGNFFMPRILTRYRDELGVAVAANEFEAAAAQTQRHLETEAARIAVENLRVADGRLTAEIAVANLAGHKLPSAYPSRRVWIRFAVRDTQGRPVFESGAPTPDGAIAGNDNDADAERYEPHYDEIDSPDQVQIYEAIMVDPAGRVTTGLLTGMRYAKDNRLLPRGFDKASADEYVAVHGGARDDRSFGAGGDRVRYAAALGRAPGPFRVEAELWYQPIAYRWALNLRGQPSAETERFVAMYRSTARASAVVLARAAASVP